MKPKVVFLGSRVLGRYALEFLSRRADINLVGKVVMADYKNEYWREDPSDLDIPPSINYNDLEFLDFDLGISVNYWRIIKEPVLSRPKLGFFNIHHSFNLMYRGVNINTFAILEARRKNIWYHGTTLHKMSPTVDSGEVVSSLSCEISENDTAFSLFCKVEALSKSLICEWFPRLWAGGIVTSPPASEFSVFRRRDMIPRQIDPSWAALEIYDRVRSLTFPPFERPYLLADRGKQYLTVSPEEGRCLYVDAGRGRRVFFLD